MVMYGKKYTSFMQKLKSFAAYSMNPRVRFFLSLYACQSTQGVGIYSMSSLPSSGKI